MHESNFAKSRWLRNAEYGFFLHFLFGVFDELDTKYPPFSQAARDAWNRRVDAFDVKRIAAQLHELGAGFAWMSIGQNSGYFCSPNAALDEIMGWDAATSQCSQRDLISDFEHALAEYGIPLMVYTTTFAPAFDREEQLRLKCVPPWVNSICYGKQQEYAAITTADFRLQGFLRRWSRIHAEWSQRWQRRVHGWWVDGGYYPDRIFDFPDDPNGSTFANALRSGNPDALIAYNPGVVYPPHRNYPHSPENITAGEINEPDFGLHCGNTIDGAQYHVLTYAGENWATAPLRFNAGQMTSITRNITDNGGVVSWDLPFTDHGIADDTFAELRKFAQMYRQSREKMPNFRFNIIPPEINDAGNLPGILEYQMDTPAAFTLHWHDSIIHEERQCGRIPLTPDDTEKFAYLDVSCNGVTRHIAVENEYRIQLPRDCAWTRPYQIKANANECIGNYRFALTDDALHIEAVINEAQSCICTPPWMNSCIEIFLTDIERKKHHQWIVTHDGQSYYADRCCCFVAPEVTCKVTRPTDGRLQLLITLPLPEELANGAFRMDIQQRVNRDSNALCGIMFGRDPALCKAIVELH